MPVNGRDRPFVSGIGVVAESVSIMRIVGIRQHDKLVHGMVEYHKRVRQHE